ncbi:MAG: hypothetical protein WCH83_03320 [Alphaproteobacteria bacterium]
MALHPQKMGLGVSVAGHVLLLAAGLIAFVTTPEPLKLDTAESVPVEVVSDEPPQAVRGDRNGRQQPTPQRVVDRQAPEQRETQDPPETRVARERVQNTVTPPPPAPRPPQPQAQDDEAATPPPPTPVARPAPTPPPPRPVPQVEREDLEAKLAELQAQQKREEERQRQETQRQETQRRQQEAREREQRETREREQREAREKQEREQREAREKQERERRQREARERQERERQERANARQFDPAAIAARLNPTQAAVNDRRDATRTEATGSTPTRTASLGTASGSSQRLSASEIDALKAQVQQCWNPPAANADAGGLIPVIDVSFNQDGSVNGRPQVTNSRSDPAFQAAANAAVRAIMRCSPYRLPASKYEAWRDVRVRFDPRDMIR